MLRLITAFATQRVSSRPFSPYFPVHIRLIPDGHSLKSSSSISAMPPKKKPTKRAREETPDSGSESEPKQKKASSSKKKAKTSTSEALDENAQPTNTTMPENIQFPVKTADTTRIATWNICGLVASQKKVRRIGMFSWEGRSDASSRGSSLMLKRRTRIS